MRHPASQVGVSPIQPDVRVVFYRRSEKLGAPQGEITSGSSVQPVRGIDGFRTRGWRKGVAPVDAAWQDVLHSPFGKRSATLNSIPRPDRRDGSKPGR